jgi:hypothetical protein
MNPHNDRLDRAIDLAANRMVSVPEDDQMLDTIVARLPERSNASWLAGFKWQLAGAAIALVAVAILSFDTMVRHDDSTPTFDPAVPIARVEPPSRTIVPPDPVEPTVRTIVPNVRLERPARTSVANDAFDRQYGLPPVSAPVEIAFKSIAVETNLVVPPSELAPIVLPALDESRD